MRHPGFGTIGNPPDRDPVRPTSDTRPSTLPRPVLDVERLATALLNLRWYSAEGIEDARIVARQIVAEYDREYSRLLEERPKVAPESESEKRFAAGDP